MVVTAIIDTRRKEVGPPEELPGLLELAPLEEPSRGLRHQPPGDEGQATEHRHRVLERLPVREEVGQQPSGGLPQDEGDTEAVAEDRRV